MQKRIQALYASHNLTKKQKKKLKKQQKKISQPVIEAVIESIAQEVVQKQQVTQQIKQQKKTSVPKKQLTNQTYQKPLTAQIIKKPKHKPIQPQQQLVQVQDGQDIDFNNLQPQDEKIDVTFLIAEIRSEYYHSMKTILKRYSQIVALTESQIADQIVERGNKGNVVIADDQQDQQQQDQQEDQQEQDNNPPQDDDELNVYSVVTIMSGQGKIGDKIRRLALSSLQKIKNQRTSHKQLALILAQPGCNILINFRLPNLPGFIVVNSHQVFSSDLISLKKTNNSQYKSLTGQYLLSVSQVEVVNNSLNLDELIFGKFQDYQFCKRSLKWWVGESLPNFRKKADLRRLYYVVKTKQYINAARKIKQYLQQ